MCNPLHKREVFPTTIREVAKRANVSEATVSRVINKKGYVGKETLKKVEAAIAELNYTPNEVARMLFKKKSNTIGLLIPDITNPFFPELAKAVEAVAQRLGYLLILCNTESNPETEKKYVRELTHKYVDGLIIMNQNNEDITYDELPFPTLFLDRVHDKRVLSVSSQNKEGGRIATEYLLQTGSKRILHIRGPHNVTTATERAEGYQEVMKKNNLAAHVMDCDYATEAAYQLGKSLFKKAVEYDAIFAGNDLIAAGVLMAAKEYQISVPDELQIIGYDGIDLCKHTSPQLTTIQQPIYKMGEQAAILLIAQIENQLQEKESSSHSFPVELIQRGTTKSLR